MSDPIGPSQQSPPAPRRSWRLQWSLRAFAVMVLIVAAVFMVISRWQRTGQLHEQVAQQLRRSDQAYIEWKHEDYQWVNPRPGVAVWRRASTISPWVKTIGAEHLFLRIDRIVINKKNAQELDPAFEKLSRLDHVGDLTLFDCQANQEQLAQWMAHTSVEKLFIENTSLGRGRLSFLNHPTMTHLHVGRTQFSNPAIDDLPISLQELDLRRTRVNDQGLDQLVRLKNLKRLVLNRTPTSEAAINKLRLKMPWCAIIWEPLKNP